jgi:type I restriction enzyme S subunit
MVTLLPEATYREVTVKMWGKGVILRGIVTGAEIASSRRFVARTGQFILSRIDARNGAIGIVPPELDGAVVTNDFPLFYLDQDRIDSAFLGWLGRTHGFVELCVRASEGTTNRVRLQEDRFLALEISLPPMAEQRRVVARIEELAAQIQEVRALREEIEENLHSMLSAAHRQIANGAPRRPLGEVAPLNRRPVTVEAEKSYPQIAVRSFGRGAFHKPPLIGSEVTWEKPFLVKTGDILVSNIKAWEGALAVARPEDDGRFGSHRYLTCVPNEGVATALFVCFHLLSPEGLSEIGEASPGSADRNRTLSAKAFMRMPIPLPEYSKQLWFDSLCREVDALRQLQTETAAELDAMLPSILNRAFREQLVVSELPGSGKAITPIGVYARPIFSAEDYFLQLIPALLRAVGGRLELDKLNAAVALLFLPKVLRPLIASVGGEEARVHFDRFNQPLKDSTFIPMLHVLKKTGAITCGASDQVTSLQLHESAAPPIKPVVEADARFLAGIVNLIPSSPVQATARKLCPEPAKEELLAMA